jgi:hypothetical protein
MLERLGVQDFPMVGTPTWCALDDDHPVKLAAAVDAAQHYALRVDMAQEQLAAAAQAISAAEDWSAIARANRDRADFIAANPWAKRVVEDGPATTENTVENTAVENTVGNTVENTAENAEGTIDCATANPWARRAAS